MEALVRRGAVFYAALREAAGLVIPGLTVLEMERALEPAPTYQAPVFPPAKKVFKKSRKPR